jgi:hypothetical protein
MGEITFSPSPDVSVVLNTLLDIFERRTTQTAKSAPERAIRIIKVVLVDTILPAYFSQIDPMPRITANEQFQMLARAGILKLNWVPGETGHILENVVLETEHVTRIYQILNRTALAAQRTRLESLLLAEKFRFGEDWRARALRQILTHLRAGKSPLPFSLTDIDLDTDLLTVMEAVPALQAETPYRVFSVRVFNDSKRLESLKNQLVSLARLGNPEWKHLPADEVLRELNLVANPNYLHLAGNWQLTVASGEILSLGGFTPALGFPAAQTASLQSVKIHAEAVLCIENLTTFHEFIRHNGNYPPETQWSGRSPDFATICTYGNPAPATRRILRLVPASSPIYHWSDLDYGGFNILSQLRRFVDERVQPYYMDIATLEANYERSRPLTVSDRANLKKLLQRPELRDVRPVIEHLLKRGVKLEQEGVENI